jgi:peptidoglycan/xylan/chitin deacetylase (PgdA/CDA1 family)
MNLIRKEARRKLAKRMRISRRAAIALTAVGSSQPRYVSTNSSFTTDNHAMRAHGIMFRHFHDGPSAGPGVLHPAGQRSISSDDLAQIIERIDRRRILPAHAFLNRAVENRLHDGDLCLTFDATLRCQYDLAVPVLENYGLTAFWFVYSSVLEGNIERPEIYRQFRTTAFHSIDDFYAAFFVVLHESPMGELADCCLRRFEPAGYLAESPFYTDADKRFRYVRDQVLGARHYPALMDRMIRESGFDIRRCARSLWMDDLAVRSLHEAGHVIGLHSHTHPTCMAELSDDEQRYEYRSNFNHLTSLLGEPPAAVSHPCNSYDDRTLAILRGLGIKLGFRSDMSDGSHGPLELPREDHANLMQRVAA